MCIRMAKLAVVSLNFATAPAPVSEVSESDIEFLKSNFAPLQKCSASFARVTALAASRFVDGERKGAFAEVLRDYLGKPKAEIDDEYASKPPGLMGLDESNLNFPEGEDDCFPLFKVATKKDHSYNTGGRFFSMSAKDAQMIAAAIRHTLLGGEAVKTNRVSFLASVAGAILNSLTADQLQVAYTMGLAVNYGETLKDDICTGGSYPKVGSEFLESIPKFKIGFDNTDYLPTLLRLLRRLRSCASEVDLVKQWQLLEPKSAKFAGNGGLQAIWERITATAIVRDPIANTIRGDTGTAGHATGEKFQTGTSLETATFIASSIANQEKIFFTNLHDASKQLSLLGIKAVGLATQIQAIRGHIMMLQLIDQHLAQLNADHHRYTKLLINAHDQLATATGSWKSDSHTDPK